MLFEKKKKETPISDQHSFHSEKEENISHRSDDKNKKEKKQGKKVIA